MNQISISQAWAYATSFFSDQNQNHAILLIGVAVGGPLILNILTGGAAAGATVTPDQLASGAGLAAVGGLAILAGLLGYVLQTGAYFASWRMGLEPGKESIGSALGYGIVAALPVLLVTIGFVLAFGIIAGVLFGATLIPLLVSGGGDAGALSSLGGLLFAVPIFLLLALWLGARFCCTGPVMAAARSFNPLTAMAQSWQMTSAAQWKLMAYFILIAIVFFIASMLFGIFAGVSMLVGGAAGSGISITTLVLSAIVSVPIAYLSVAVPAGIYRALGGGNASDVFA